MSLGQRVETGCKNIWNQIQHELPSEKWIVRSSALNEDTEASSQAGKFESVGDVSGQESFFCC